MAVLSERTPLLQVNKLSKRFTSGGSWGQPKKTVYAVSDVSFSLFNGETVGLVGESGCGKSTLARCVMQLIKPSEGSVLLENEELTRLKGNALRQRRQDFQMIFQNPHSSLNPRMKVGDCVAEPLKIHKVARGKQLKERVDALLEQVGLPVEAAERYPHAFSGGQRQRIGIARALALNPKLIVADEPLSALDVSIQAQILNLLQDLKQEHGLSYLMIAHNLDVVRAVCDRVLVMYLGRIVEQGPVEEVFNRPRHPYTQALLAAAPVADPRLAKENLAKRQLLEGEPPSPLKPWQGCAFATRCPVAEESCFTWELAHWQNPDCPTHQALCWKAGQALIESPLA